MLEGRGASGRSLSKANCDFLPVFQVARLDFDTFVFYVPFFSTVSRRGQHGSQKVTVQGGRPGSGTEKQRGLPPATPASPASRSRPRNQQRWPLTLSCALPRSQLPTTDTEGASSEKHQSEGPAPGDLLKARSSSQSLRGKGPELPLRSQVAMWLGGHRSWRSQLTSKSSHPKIQGGSRNSVTALTER